MEINSILKEISSSLEKIAISNRVNNYNLISGRLGGPQYTVSFNELVNSELNSPNDIQSSVVINKIEQSMEDIIMRSVKLSSDNNRLIDVMNRRIEIERLVLKGNR
ncbi:hypothetical protein AB4179_13820 [Vibrio lentus]|uniref:hypothetical protein n=1 Tax=Vibrio TaxID=662 RepID=UPI000C82C5DD|nr:MULTISPECIES: hypothetical protein [Vibrio]PMO21117.1 hypothetical protein BCT15_15205 [Vibrio splendidus]WGS63059.1 hypothetical protein ISX51_23820 [Vibrio lentus]